MINKLFMSYYLLLMNYMDLKEYQGHFNNIALTPLAPVATPN